MPSIRALALALTAAVLPAVTLAAPAAQQRRDAQTGHWGPHHGHGQGYGKEAIYFLRVDPAGSSVVAIEVDSDGLLTDKTTSTSTGGNGQQATNATSGTAVGIDPLQGQQAVSVGENYLFTINSGSDTVVMFSIDPEDPLELSMVGQPMPTLGEFAMSVAYSSKYQKACVLNGGAVNGVACYSVDAAKGLVPDGAGLRSFGYDYVTPPVLGGPKGSGSDVQFSPDSSKLIATLKGDAKPSTLGHINVFDVDSSGAVATTWKDNQVSPLSAIFGFAFDYSEPENIYVTDAGFGGGATVSLNYNTDEVSLIKVVNVSSFAASCWVVYSPETNEFWDINAGSPKIGRVNPESGDLESVIKYPKKLGGAEDAVVIGSKIYMLTSVNVVMVIDASSGDVLQQFTYAHAANRPFWTGMASYPASPELTGGV